MILEKDFTYRESENIKKIVNSELNSFRKYIGLNQYIQNVDDLMTKMNILEKKVYEIEKRQRGNGNILKRLFRKK
jgi:hypothetical protein